jgi:hypothetical protein
VRAPIIALAVLGCGHPAPAPAPPAPAPVPTPAPAQPGCRGFPPESLVIFTSDGEHTQAKLVAQPPDLDIPEPEYPMLNWYPVDLDGDGRDDQIVVFDCGDDKACNFGAYVACDGTRWIRVWGPRYASDLGLAKTRTMVDGASWADLSEERGHSCDEATYTIWRFDGRAYREDPRSTHPIDCH